jgi:hypothetical protein
MIPSDKNPTTDVILKKIASCNECLNRAYSFMEDVEVPYKAVSTILSLAYTTAPSSVIKSKISDVNHQTKDFAKKQRRFNRATDRANSKQLRGRERKLYLANYSFTKDARDKLRKALHDCINLVFLEKTKWEGNIYETIADAYTNELSFDKDNSPVVINDASVMVHTNVPIKKDVFTEPYKNNFQRVETNFYAVATRVVGVKPSYVPENPDHVSLGNLIYKHLSIKGVTPHASPMKHKNSKRIWFAIFDFPINVKNVFFTDSTHMRSEMEIARDISSANSMEEISRILESIGISREEAMTYSMRAAPMSARDRVGLVYQIVTKQLNLNKTNQLKSKRMEFLNTHKEIVSAIKENENLIDDLKAVAHTVSQEFLIKSEDGRGTVITIGQSPHKLQTRYMQVYKSILYQEQVESIRDYKIKTLKADYMELREMYWTFRMAKDTIKAIKKILNNQKDLLEFKRKIHNNEEVELTPV